MAIADAGYAGDGPTTAALISVEVGRKPAEQVGFAVHTRDFIWERFSGQISRNRRLRNDSKAALASAEALLSTADVMILVRRMGQAACF